VLISLCIFETILYNNPSVPLLGSKLKFFGGFFLCSKMLYCIEDAEKVTTNITIAEIIERGLFLLSLKSRLWNSINLKIGIDALRATRKKIGILKLPKRLIEVAFLELYTS